MQSLPEPWPRAPSSHSVRGIRWRVTDLCTPRQPRTTVEEGSLQQRQVRKSRCNTVALPSKRCAGEIRLLAGDVKMAVFSTARPHHLGHRVRKKGWRIDLGSSRSMRGTYWYRNNRCAPCRPRTPPPSRSQSPSRKLDLSLSLPNSSRALRPALGPIPVAGHGEMCPGRGHVRTLAWSSFDRSYAAALMRRWVIALSATGGGQYASLTN